MSEPLTQPEAKFDICAFLSFGPMLCTSLCFSSGKEDFQPAGNGVSLMCSGCPAVSFLHCIYRTQSSRCFPRAEAEDVVHLVTRQRFVVSQHHDFSIPLCDSVCSALSGEVFYHMMVSSEQVFR